MLPHPAKSDSSEAPHVPSGPVDPLIQALTADGPSSTAVALDDPTSAVPDPGADHDVELALDPMTACPKRRLLDVTLAASMLVAAAPVLAAAAVTVRLVDGAPIFYRGERLGLGVRPFPLVKIRTLRTDAQARIGGQLLTDSHGLKTRTGSFLRETRLDELPQLLHVIRGHMALFGPRPERAEVYREKCATIPHYTDRFLVRPGVFGYSQILTPHGTPKRLRAIIDRQFVHAPRSSTFDLALLGLTLGSLLKETGVRIARFGKSQRNQRVRGRYHEQRLERRVRPPVPTSVTSKSYGDGTALELRDLTTTAFCAKSCGQVDVSQGSIVTLVIRIPNTYVVRRARVEILSSTARITPEGGSVVAMYRPCSENSQYVIEQYLLNKSIVQLPEALRRHRRHLRPAK